MPFTQALSLPQRAELSAAPLLPVRSCGLHEASPQLLCSGLSKPGDLSAPHTPCPSDSSPSSYPSSGCSLTVVCPSGIVALKGHTVLEVRPHSAEQSGTTLPLAWQQCWAWCVPFGQPGHAAGSHQLATSQNTRSLSVGLLSHLSSPVSVNTVSNM